MTTKCEPTLHRETHTHMNRVEIVFLITFYIRFVFTLYTHAIMLYSPSLKDVITKCNKGDVPYNMLLFCLVGYIYIYIHTYISIYIICIYIQHTHTHIYIYIHISDHISH